MHSKRITLTLFFVTALVLATLVTWLTWSVRGQLRAVFIDQHGQILKPLADSQLEGAREALSLTGDAFDVSDLLSLVLSDVRMDNLIDVSLFDTDGFLISDDLGDSLAIRVQPLDRERALRGEPSSHYHSMAVWDDFFPESMPARQVLGIPLIEVVVPLRDEGDGSMLAMARYLLDGEETANGLKVMDGQLMRISATLLGAALLFLAGIFAWAYCQSKRAQEAVEESNQRLIELNHQLAFADKSSAVGTLSAHLIHGLKNPLAALRALFQESVLTEEHAAHGKERVREMQRMIDHSVDVLRDEESALVYEYKLDEVRTLLWEKTRAKADRRGADVHLGKAPDQTLTGRQGNVLLLILVNLVENALEASPPGGRVVVTFLLSGEDALTVEVQDEGSGIPPEMQERLFVPKKSGKAQGTGIGLVISAQLARQINGKLQLLETGPRGSTFAVSLVAEIVADGSSLS